MIHLKLTKNHAKRELVEWHVIVKMGVSGMYVYLSLMQALKYKTKNLFGFLSLILSQSLLHLNSSLTAAQFWSERRETMESKILLVSVLASLFGLLSAALGFAAEGKRIKVNINLINRTRFLW